MKEFLARLLPLSFEADYLLGVRSDSWAALKLDCLLAVPLSASGLGNVKIDCLVAVCSLLDAAELDCLLAARAVSPSGTGETD